MDNSDDKVEIQYFVDSGQQTHFDVTGIELSSAEHTEILSYLLRDIDKAQRRLGPLAADTGDYGFPHPKLKDYRFSYIKHKPDTPDKYDRAFILIFTAQRIRRSGLGWSLKDSGGDANNLQSTTSTTGQRVIPSGGPNEVASPFDIKTEIPLTVGSLYAGLAKDDDPDARQLRFLIKEHDKGHSLEGLILELMRRFAGEKDRARQGSYLMGLRKIKQVYPSFGPLVQILEDQYNSSIIKSKKVLHIPIPYWSCP